MFMICNTELEGKEKVKGKYREGLPSEGIIPVVPSREGTSIRAVEWGYLPNGLHRRLGDVAIVLSPISLVF
jgi:hypothetical protein